MGPGDLSRALAALPEKSDPRLLVGRETFDDAGVFRMSDDLALVQTVDFFAPIVDDPFDFGQVAAANALSDVYAMGGQPLTAMNIVAFPTSELPLDVLGEILAGGQEKVHEAGAFERGQLPADVERAMLDAMKTLNGTASRAALAVSSRCATDITGFGLLGHLSHIARASNVSVRVDLAAIPVFAGVRDAVKAGFVTDGAKRNADYLRELVRWSTGTEEDKAVLYDPQTSGGLAVCVSRPVVANYLSRVAGSTVIGEVIDRGEFAIEVQ